MKLDSLEAVPYSLPFSEPYVTARGELRERELLLVRARADGLEGLGETAALSLRGGRGVRALEREIRELCGPHLTDAGFEPKRIWSALAHCRTRGASPAAIAGLDIALHDLAAKAAGIPLWRFLGATEVHPVVCNATLAAANPTVLVGAVERWADAGFRTFKLKVGLAGDVAQVTAARTALGPEPRIRLDANGAWSDNEAEARLSALAKNNIELVEEPVSGLQLMARLRPKTRIPIAADESVNSVRDARRAVEMNACNLATVKLAKVGGLAAALEIAEEFPVYLSSALEGPVGIAAAAHTAQALPERAITSDLAHGLATERMFSSSVGSGIPFDGDKLMVGYEPGLGVTIDEAALAARHIL